jgi:hypothetical protein
MAGYIKFNRDFRKLPIWRKSSAEQREVLLELVERIQYAERRVSFGGKAVLLSVGDLFVSRSRLVACLACFGVKDSHVRNMLKKLVTNGYLELMVSSRNDGSIYRCLDVFFEDIAMPFDTRKLTNDKPTTDQRLTNDKPTIDQPKQSNINGLNGVLTNDKPKIDQRLTANRPTIDHSIKKKKKNKENIHNHLGNSDFDSKKIVPLNSDFENERKKVAAKKESFDFPPCPITEDPLKVYFESSVNVDYFSKRFPLLVIETEFSKIYDALLKKAANGGVQLNNPFPYVNKCLENAETARQQRENGQKSLKSKSNGNYKNTARSIGKHIPADKFKNYKSENVIILQ